MLERRILFAPSILSADFARLGEHVREAEEAGADLLHIDVMDGHFVPNITIGPLVVRALRPVTGLPLHVHLMIEQPERYIDDFARAGADLITVHVETCPHLHRTLQQIREVGALPAVTLNPATPLSNLSEVLAMVDTVLIMTVNPGFGGQELIPATLDKVRRLRQMLDERGLRCTIEVDGGVNEETIRSVVEAGADSLVMGSAIFGSPHGVRGAIEGLRARLA
ncbi:MAG: ribulose-phosphate 3-epimerase [Chloroflexi bacterium]|jgi:ribulose-phosphate 3-epimerase|nr:ribulose-phosphate 3-epimerase [Chloroflexota bacterium]